MKNENKLALESFLNDVTTKVANNLYFWHISGQYYQVFPYTNIPKKYSKDSFIKIEYKGISYGMREMSVALLRKYYPQFLLTWFDNRRLD